MKIDEFLNDKENNISKINPFFRYIQMIFNYDYEHFVPKRQMYNFFMLYVIDGEMSVDFFDVKYNLNPGDLVVIPPKTLYKENIPDGKYCKYYVMDFDMVYDENRKWWNRKKLYLKYCRNDVEEAPFDNDLVSESDLNYSLFKCPIVVKDRNTIKILELLKNTLDLYEKFSLKKENIITELRLKANVLTIFSLIIEAYDSDINNKDYSFINSFIEYAMEHYGDSFDVKQVIKDIGYSPNYFRTIFKKETGVTPFEYLLYYRIKMAKELLSKNYTVIETANRVGFTNEFYFSKVFKKHVGKSPKSYKQQFHINK